VDHGERRIRQQDLHLLIWLLAIGYRDLAIGLLGLGYWDWVIGIGLLGLGYRVIWDLATGLNKSALQNRQMEGPTFRSARDRPV
jgi:hypothetical protein